MLLQHGQMIPSQVSYEIYNSTVNHIESIPVAYTDRHKERERNRERNVYVGFDTY